MPQFHHGYVTKRVAINNVSGSEQTIVAAVPGKRIHVLSYFVSADGSTDLTWLSDSTVLSGPAALSAAGPTGLTHSGAVLETAAGEALKTTTTAAINGHLSYIEMSQ